MSYTEYFNKLKALQKEAGTSEEFLKQIQEQTQLKIQNATKLFLCGYTPFSKKAYNFFMNQFPDKEVYLIDDEPEEINTISWNEAPVNTPDTLWILGSRAFNDRYFMRLAPESKVIPFYPVVLLYPELSSQRYAYHIESIRQRTLHTLEHFPEYLDLFEQLEDSKSKEVLARILLFRLTCDMRLNIGAGKEKIHYFNEDIYTLSDHESVIDGGGYDGDTLESFLKACSNQFEHYYFFEPSSKSMTAAKAKFDRDPRITFIPCGMYSHRMTTAFTSDSVGNINLADQGEEQIQLDAIDNFHFSPVTVLKMDIEGSEMMALKGARETIVREKPILTICAYHRWEDILDLYHYIREFGGYSFYLRAERDSLENEITLYAVPQSRKKNVR